MNDLHPDLVRVLLTEEEIQTRVVEIAAEIDRDYAGVERIYLVGVLKGAFMFMADLARRLKTAHNVDFMAVSSYGAKGATAGEVRMILDLREPIAGEHVLIVEDIADSGKTLNYLINTLQSRNPASLRTAVFVRKERRSLPVQLDYLGFDIPDVWVVGYGLDFADRRRTLPFVAEMRQV